MQFLYRLNMLDHTYIYEVCRLLSGDTNWTVAFK